MKRKTLKIATRSSPLAMWQAEHVQQELLALHPDLEVELVGIKTRGDKILDTPLYEVGGKGLFIKELEHALLDGRADIAVHSMKDVTVDFPAGLTLSVIMRREDPRDAFISNHYQSLDDLPQSACVGTASLRRQCQVRAARPDLVVKTLRGNVGTRLRKLDEGSFDAIILAAAGVKRLQIEDRVKQYLSREVMLPAIGQGAMGIESRSDDGDILELIQPLNDETTAIQLIAERTVSRQLYGGCHLPIAAYAEIDGDTIMVSGLVGRVDGSTILIETISGKREEAEALALQLSQRLLDKGADEILRELVDE